jgi:uncharacterized circularly permuted ATP-grasp superfamily protein
VTATCPYPPSAGFYDEAIDPEGEPREAGGAGLALLGDDVAALATGVREALGDRGVRFRSDGGAAEHDDIVRVRAQLIARPQDFVAQPTIEISLHPTVIGGQLQPRHVDLRPFVFLRGHGKAAVMPGGLTRVAFEEGTMVVNSTQNGGAKDTWVLP